MQLGFTVDEVAQLCYTEQGMQDDNYVSMEAHNGQAFVAACLRVWGASNE